MTNAEKILASLLLERAAHEFARHGCNDMDDELTGHISHEEKIAMANGFNKWNGNHPEEDSKFQHIGDFSWMAYLAARLKEEVTIMETLGAGET